MSGVARHVVDLKPRWADMDAYGHVNNVTWLEYLQEARVDMFRALAATPAAACSSRASWWRAC